MGCARTNKKVNWEGVIEMKYTLSSKISDYWPRSSRTKLSGGFTFPKTVRPKHPIDFKSNKAMVKAWKQFQKTGKY